MSRPDLLTVSVGAERAAWVRANKWPASLAMQRAIDEAMAGPAPIMPRSIGRRKVRVLCLFRRRGLYQRGVLAHVVTRPDPSVSWSRLRSHLWTVRAPATELARLVGEAEASGRVVATVSPVLLMAVVPPMEVTP
jgi:hypothetical protein